MNEKSNQPTVVGTIGHIDSGKTNLFAALTRVLAAGETFSIDETNLAYQEFQAKVFEAHRLVQEAKGLAIKYGFDLTPEMFWSEVATTEAEWQDSHCVGHWDSSDMNC